MKNEIGRNNEREGGKKGTTHLSCSTICREVHPHTLNTRMSYRLMTRGRTHIILTKVGRGHYLYCIWYVEEEPREIENCEARWRL